MSKSWLAFVSCCAGILVAWLAYMFSSPAPVDENVTEALEAKEARIASLQRKSQPQDILSYAPPQAQKDQVDDILDLLASGDLESAIEIYRENITELAVEESIIRAVLDALMRAERYVDAFELLYEQRLFISYEQEQALLALIHKEVLIVEEVLSENGEVDLIIEMYQRLINQEADYAPYYLRLTHWLLEQGEPEIAEQSLSGARNEFVYADQVAELEQRIVRALSQQDGETDLASWTVPLQKKADHFIVEVELDTGVSVNLMIDTGASMTVIKEDIFDLVEPSDAEYREVEMVTANGTAIGRQTVVPTFKLGEVPLTEVAVVSMPLERFEYDGLLGMNVLNQYQFFIDQENEVMYLR